jgi:transcriptional regulator with XRE-family HTH domain
MTEVTGPSGGTPLAALIAERMTNTGDTLADIAHRGGLPRQTVSNLLNRGVSGGIPRRSTLAGLARGLGLSVAVVTEAASRSASPSDDDDAPTSHRVTVLTDCARHMPDRHVDVLLACARALERLEGDTP